MSLRVAIQMDPIAGIDIAGDTSFALALEAQSRGHDLFYYLPDRLAMVNGRVRARVQSLQVQDLRGDHFALGSAESAWLDTFDVILLRQDPPFDMHYITTTHFLDTLEDKVLVVNNARAVRNAPEKLLVTRFPHLMPPTLITRDVQELAAFRAEHQDLILKPLYGNGGAGIFRVRPDDENFNSLLEMFLKTSREQVIAQAYMPAVRAGDKRVILVEGEAVGALNRIPAAGDARSNVHVGGRPELAEVTERDHEIAAEIGPLLREMGLIFAGIDVIGGLLTEINVTSPTCIREIKNFGGPDIGGLIWDAIETRRSAGF
jgi:glutathione synthase